ncbi:hypothetical protein MKX54_03680 [Alkalihalobacillus sp. FSL R5-0424]
MLQKSIKFIPALVLVSSLFAAYSQSADAQEDLNSEVIVSEDNIYEVLEFYDVPASDFDDNYIPEETVDGITVGEFGEILEEIKSENDQEANTQLTSGDEEVSLFSTGTQMLNATTNGGSYDVNYQVVGGYSGNSWTSAGAATVDVVSNSATAVHTAIDQNISTSIVGNNIRMDAEVTVEHRFGFSWGSIRTHESNVTTNASWGTKHIPS